MVIYSAGCRVQIGWISLDSFRAGPGMDAEGSDTSGGQTARARQDEVTADGDKLVCTLPPAPRPCRKRTRPVD